MPSRPEASTKPRAERAKLSRSAALEATIGNVSVDPLPPIDKMTCKCGCFCLRLIKDPRAPWEALSQGAAQSAHSSLSCGRSKKKTGVSLALVSFPFVAFSLSLSLYLSLTHTNTHTLSRPMKVPRHRACEPLQRAGSHAHLQRLHRRP